MTFAGFFFLNITLELFCVFKNTENNGSKYAHFSLYYFINYCEFIIRIFKIILKPFIFRTVAGGSTSERQRREPPSGVWGHAPLENFEN